MLHKPCRRRDIAVPIILYTVLQLVQASLPYWLGTGYRFFPNYVGKLS